MDAVMIVFAITFLIQIYAKDLEENYVVKVYDSLDEKVDRIIDQVLKASLLQFADTNRGALYTRSSSRVPRSPFLIPRPSSAFLHYFPVSLAQGGGRHHTDAAASYLSFHNSTGLAESRSVARAETRNGAMDSVGVAGVRSAAAACSNSPVIRDDLVSLLNCVAVKTFASSRRSLLTNAAVVGVGALTASAAPHAAQASITKDAEWPLWPALPLAPYSRRKTICRQAGPRVWIFEQLFGILYVHVPIRMTVIAMEAGGLFAYAPIAPTRECLALLEPLITEYGPLKYIVLPSTALEHKVLAGPFARAFPLAEFYATDKQYSIPNFPSTFLGFPPSVKLLPPSSRGASLFGDEFEHEVLTIRPGVSEALYQDAAFFHKPTKTLLLCDALFSISDEPPPILTSEPEYLRAALFHARDDPLELVVDSPEARRKGWQRMAIFANFLFPGAVFVANPGVWLPAAAKTPMPELGWGGLLPWKFRHSWVKSFEALSANGKPAVPPIIQGGFLAHGPEATQRWLDTVVQWQFERVVPVHFDAPLAMGPAQFAEAFDFLRGGRNQVRFCDEDVAFLRSLLDALPPFLTLYDTELGSLSGRACSLV